MHSKKLAVVVGVLMSAGMVMAQGSGSKGLLNTNSVALVAMQSEGGQGGDAGNHHRSMNPDKAAKRLGRKLNLSADQVAQIRPILADRQQQMQALRADTTLSQQDRHAKAQGIMRDSKTKLEAVMNDQQKEQFEQMIAARQARHHNMNGAQQPQQN